MIFPNKGFGASLAKSLGEHGPPAIQRLLEGEKQKKENLELGLPAHVSPETRKALLSERGKQARAQSLEKLGAALFSEAGVPQDIDYSSLAPEDLFKFAELQRKREETGVKRKQAEEKELAPSKKYLEETRQKAQRAQTLKPVFDELRQTVEAGGADAFTAGNLTEVGDKMGGFLGGTLSAIGKANESGETGKFRSLSKRLLDEMKDIFGSQIRVSELQVFLSMIPQIGKNKEANLASLDVLEKLSQASERYYDTAQDIINENDGKTPKDLADQVHKRLGGELQDIAKDLSETLKVDKKIVSEEKKEGKEITKDIAQKFLKEAKGDKAKARELAKKKGYKF